MVGDASVDNTDTPLSQPATRGASKRDPALYSGILEEWCSMISQVVPFLA